MRNKIPPIFSVRSTSPTRFSLLYQLLFLPSGSSLAIRFSLLHKVLPPPTASSSLIRFSLPHQVLIPSSGSPSLTDSPALTRFSLPHNVLPPSPGQKLGSGHLNTNKNCAWSSNHKLPLSVWGPFWGPPCLGNLSVQGHLRVPTHITGGKWRPGGEATQEAGQWVVFQLLRCCLRGSQAGWNTLPH